LIDSQLLWTDSWDLTRPRKGWLRPGCGRRSWPPSVRPIQPIFFLVGCAGVDGKRRLVCYQKLEKSLIGPVYVSAIASSEKVEEEASCDGNSESRIDPSSVFVCSCLDHGICDRSDPRVDDPVQKAVGSRASEQGVRVELEEES
jgi:hypothetical protein